jgi:hypothetical protein
MSALSGSEAQPYPSSVSLQIPLAIEADGTEAEPSEGGGGSDKPFGDLPEPRDSLSKGRLMTHKVEVFGIEGEDPDWWGDDPLENVVTPVLAGFALAAVVIIGTTSERGYPARSAASTLFACAAVSLIFSMQMLALKRRGLELRFRGRPVDLRSFAKKVLYELGLLLVLVGIGLFLWPNHWSAASVIGVAAAFLAALIDAGLTVYLSWRARNDRRRAEAPSPGAT